MRWSSLSDFSLSIDRAVGPLLVGPLLVGFVTLVPFFIWRSCLWSSLSGYFLVEIVPWNSLSALPVDRSRGGAS
jgi:hypothetical protein